MHYLPSVNKTTFLSWSKRYNLLPVWIDLSADIFTPVEVYLSLKKKGKASYLLESVEQSAGIARYSFIGFEPIETVAISGEHPRRKLNALLNAFKVPLFGHDFPFSTGLVGYISYDMVRFFEPVKVKSQSEYPEAMFMLPSVQIYFDHVKKLMRVVKWVDLRTVKKRNVEKLYSEAVKELNNIVGAIIKGRNLPAVEYSRLNELRKKVKGAFKSVRSNFTKKQFLSAVEQAKEHIYNGDIVQVVLSQRFEFETNAQPFDVYRVLRLLNPSPYMFFVDFPESKLSLVGASPEMLVRLNDGVIETHPIAGTRRRGKDLDEDKRLAEDLLNDPKEIAEHVMLVDLGRNDVGRVAKLGSVEVKDFMHIEYFSHVMHIVSRVLGTAKKGIKAIDVLSSAFPAGTVSGAPKIRAMEIIDELEPCSRGVYAGGVGYFDFRGNMDICIAIRTIVFYNNRSLVQAGAGIVADSVPELEFKETQNKARAQILAVRLAEKIGKKEGI